MASTLIALFFLLKADAGLKSRIKISQTAESFPIHPVWVGARLLQSSLQLPRLAKPSALTRRVHLPTWDRWSFNLDALPITISFPPSSNRPSSSAGRQSRAAERWLPGPFPCSVDGFEPIEIYHSQHREKASLRPHHPTESTYYPKVPGYPIFNAPNLSTAHPLNQHLAYLAETHRPRQDKISGGSSFACSTHPALGCPASLFSYHGGKKNRTKLIALPTTGAAAQQINCLPRHGRRADSHRRRQA